MGDGCHCVATCSVDALGKMMMIQAVPSAQINVLERAQAVPTQSLCCMCPAHTIPLGRRISASMAGCYALRSVQVRLYEDEQGHPLARPTYHRSCTKRKGTSRPSTPAPKHEEQEMQQHQETQLPQQHSLWCSMRRWTRRALLCNGAASCVCGCYAATDSAAMADNAHKPQAGSLEQGACQSKPSTGGSSTTQWVYEDELAHRPYRWVAARLAPVGGTHCCCCCCYMRTQN